MFLFGKTATIGYTLNRVRLMFVISVISGLLLFPDELAAQLVASNTNQGISVEAKNLSYKEIFDIIEQQVPYKFAYNPDLVSKQKKLNISAKNKTLEEILRILTGNTNITYTIVDNQIILSEAEPVQQFTISGFITDSISGESLPGAIVYIPEKKAGTYANNYGFYSITQSKTDSIEIVISSIGFNPIRKRIAARQNSTLNLNLISSNVELNSVYITDKKADDNIRKFQAGREEISIDRMKATPSVVGNGDILGSIQMMPGVLAGLDGRPGYFIRGGNTDQNLVQLDEATLYNPNHLLGLVGIFNSSAIKNAYLLKAGFPASFGDHLSSVLDVVMKDGNDQQPGGDIQIGNITSGFTLESPILKDKASLFIAARRSTIDWILQPFDISNYYSNYHFYDLNGKVNVKISPKDRLFLSFYQGRDFSEYNKDTTAIHDIHFRVRYGNQAMGLRWNHIFSQKLFSNTTLIYNSYFHLVQATQNQYKKPTDTPVQYYAELYSGIKDVEAKTDFSYYPNINHHITMGVNYLYQTLLPASVTNKDVPAGNDTQINTSKIPEKYSNRIAAYGSDEVKLGSKFNAYIGARMPIYFNNLATYIQFEPRISFMYLLSPSSSIKVSYTHMHQYLHLVQSFNASFPAQIWIGSSKLVKPQNCQETSLGLFKNFSDNMFQTSMEVYYKQLGNQLLFRGGSSPAIESDMESTLIFGKGKTYGLEVYLSKTKGRFTGWLAYTLSYSYQKFDSLNRGKQFPFANDRRHSLSLSASYSIGKHWRISSNFIYSSGSAFSLFQNISGNSWGKDNPLYYYSGPDSQSGGNSSGNDSGDDSGGGSHKSSGDSQGKAYEANPYVPSTEIVQNNYRMAPYHRLDLSASYQKTMYWKNRRIDSELVFSVYNVYARHNTFFAYCSIDPDTYKPIAVEVSFVPVIPSISYNIKF